MDIINNTMEEALAEILRVDVDLINMLNLDIQMNIGNNDFLYGYYVEFPTKKSIDKNVLALIKQKDIDKIPWGETEFYSEADFGNTEADPFGWKSEWEEETYYQSHAPSKENILEKLQNIETKITEQKNDELVLKALIFSAFSITESYMRSLVWDVIPDFDFTELDDKLKGILKKDLIYKLSRNDTRKKLFKELTGKTLKPIPNFLEIRNSLAHNMFSAEIIDDNIIIKDKNDIDKPFNIKSIIDELKKYVDKPIN